MMAAPPMISTGAAEWLTPRMRKEVQDIIEAGEVLAADAFRANWEQKEDTCGCWEPQLKVAPVANVLFLSGCMIVDSQEGFIVVKRSNRQLTLPIGQEPERWERIYQKQQQLFAQAKYRRGFVGAAADCKPWRGSKGLIHPAVVGAQGSGRSSIGATNSFNSNALSLTWPAWEGHNLAGKIRRRQKRWVSCRPWL
eukprot:Skav204142  [mRNA]  locus=scaffold903:80630:82249:+ [translate_table: standard]